MLASDNYLKTIATERSLLDTYLVVSIWASAVFELSVDLAHWVFAIKYWDLSHKLKELADHTTNQKPYKLWLTQVMNFTMWSVIWVGNGAYIFCLYYIRNHVPGMSETAHSATKTYLMAYSLFPCCVSLLFLVDAFRRMYSIRSIVQYLSL